MQGDRELAVQGDSVEVKHTQPSVSGGPGHIASPQSPEKPHCSHLLQEVCLLCPAGERLDVGVQLAHLLQGPLPSLVVEGRHRHLPAAGGGEAEGGVNLGEGQQWSLQHKGEAPPTSSPRHCFFSGHTSLPRPAHQLGPAGDGDWRQRAGLTSLPTPPSHTHIHTTLHLKDSTATVNHVLHNAGELLQTAAGKGCVVGLPDEVWREHEGEAVGRHSADSFLSADCMEQLQQLLQHLKWRGERKGDEGEKEGRSGLSGGRVSPVCVWGGGGV